MNLNKLFLPYLLLIRFVENNLLVRCLMSDAKRFENNAMFKFEKLKIWQKAMDFGEDMTILADRFPRKEIYNLSSQPRRAADSIALNISEGSIEQSKPEFNRFLGYSIRSLAEVITCLHKAKRRNYLELNTFDNHYKEAYHLMNMMIAFKKTIK